MKVTIIAVGKIKEHYLKEGIEEYSKRLSRFCDLRIIEAADEPAPDDLSAAREEQIKSREAARVLGKVRDGDYLIVLDVKGAKKSSEEFTEVLKNCMVSGNSSITFIIGGSLGLAPELIRKANVRLSLSDMTFPHQLTRLILLEQIYRAFKIINGETYHK